MKKLFLPLLLVAASSTYAQSPTQIVFTWTNNNVGFPICSSTVTSTCIVGQTITDTTVSGSPVVLSSSITATATTYSAPVPAYTASTRSYTLVVNYKDASGNAQTTPAVTATVTVPFTVNPPTGFSVKLQ